MGKDYKEIYPVRVRQIYNYLVNSNVYDIVGSLDTTKYKANETPHNIRKVILGINGMFVEDYVSLNGKEKYRVHEIKNELIPMGVNSDGSPAYQERPEWVKRNLDSKKGLIDALVLSRKFSNVEEIIINLSGLSDTEYTFEVERVNQFVASKSTLGTESFKRLRYVAVLRNYEIQKWVDLKERYSEKAKSKNGASLNLLMFLVEHGGLAKEKIDYREFDVSKDDKGCIPYGYLNSKDYVMDSDYTEYLQGENKGSNLPDKYRLSKYFYEERQYYLKKYEELLVLNRRKELRKVVSTYLKAYTKNVLSTWISLYKTHFMGSPQIGVLGNSKNGSPVIVSGVRDNELIFRSKPIDEQTISDRSVYDAIVQKYPNLANTYWQEGSLIPTWKEMKEKSYVLLKFHLYLQRASLIGTEGDDLISVRNWLKESKGVKNIDDWRKKNNEGHLYLKRWKDVESWYTWILENIYLRCLEDNGVNIDNALEKENITKINEVSGVLSNTLKNIIVVSSRKPLESMEIRISSGNSLDSDSLIGCISEALNKGLNTGEESIDVSEKSENENNVKVLSILYDKDFDKESTIFAGDVIQDLIDSGNRPTWDNALIGRKEDGTPFYWDKFMNPEKEGPSDRCYTIYAASRSGKGIMTSTLLASALCDRKQVFYTDGKPENGAVMGLLSWKKGREAYVFDGKYTGAKPFVGPMEKWASPVRQEGEVKKFAENLPKQLFDNTNYFNPVLKEKYLGLMRYLSSMSVCFNIIIARANGDLPMDNWQVWVFDEMTSMSHIELEVRNAFRKYCNKKDVPCSVKKTEGLSAITTLDKIKPELINPSSSQYDEGIAFINKWLDWNSSITSLAREAAVISLGKASTNLIFIFQEPSWIKDGNHGEFTTIGNIVKLLKSTKIVGNGGIVAGAKEYGDDTIKTEWRTKVDSGTGYWAISHSADIKGRVTLFKPYSLWTIPINADKSLSDRELSDEEATRYFGGYVTKLLGNYGVDPADVLESAYTYADNAVRKLGLNKEGLKDYIYDCALSSATVKDSSIDIGVMEETLDEKVSRAISTLSPTYTSIINEIEKDRNKLDTMSRKDDKLPAFNNAKSECLKNFNGKYLDKRNKFMSDSINKTVKDADVKAEVFNYYNEKFDKDFDRLMSEINAKSFNDNPLGEQVSKEEVVEKSGVHDYKPETKDEESKGSLGVFGFDDEEEIDLFGDNEDTPKSSQTTTSRNQSKEEYQQPPRVQRPQGQPNSTSNDGRNKTFDNFIRDINKVSIYKEILKIENNPFETYSSDSTNDILLSTKEFSEILLQDIQKHVGSFDAITHFTISKYGHLIFNKVAYFPQFEESFLNTLPATIRRDLEDGALVTYFDLGNVYKFKHLVVFTIEGEWLAQGRARKEMGIGFRKRWSVLFKKFDELMFIQVGDIQYERENPDTNVEQSWLDKFKNNPASTFASGNVSRLDKVWDSKPVRALTTAFGWTMGVQAVWLAATLFGPMGLLFGAIAAGSAYKQIKDERQQKQAQMPKAEKPKQIEAPKSQREKSDSKSTSKQDNFNPLGKK